MRYNALLVAQGFSQMHDINYEKTYSLVMDAITFRIISLANSKGLSICLMNVVIVYLYGLLDNVIYMQISDKCTLLKCKEPFMD